MYRVLTVVAFGLMFAGAASAEDAKKLTIRWHGQSFFEVHTSEGTNVVIDPHAIDAFGRVNIPSADLIICSHRHTDHTRVEVIGNSKDCPIIYGVEGDQVGKQKWNEMKGKKIKDVSVSLVGTYHDEVKGLKRGLNSVIILEVDGLRIVHLGDVGHTLTENEIKKIGKVDVLMIPVGGVYTINGSEAKEVVEQLQPSRYILPMHYGTPSFDDLLPAQEFLEGEKNVEKLKTNELVIDTSKKVDHPTITVLQPGEK